MYLFVGSGDIGDLLAEENTDAHFRLWNKFLNNQKPNYNALNTSIDAFRTGAILEERFFQILPDGYYFQEMVINSEMDALKVTLDFPLYRDQKIIDFDELKTVNFDDYLIIEKLRQSEYSVYINFIKKYYKKYYNQLQSQLFTTGLDSANLVFLCVYSYIDEDNYNRDIKENEYIKFKVYRDSAVINLIKDKLTPFQNVKNYYRHGIRIKSRTRHDI